MNSGFDGQRIPPIALMAIMGYLESELADGKLFNNPAVGTTYDSNVKAFHSIMLKAVPAFGSDKNGSTLIRNAHGAAFQLLHAAMLNAAGEELIGLEVPRDVVVFSEERALEARNIKDKALIFGRDVDIATKGVDGEVWHEVKSWKSKAEGSTETDKPYPATPWKWATGNRGGDDKIDVKTRGTASHKQFSLDRVAKLIGVIKRKDKSAVQPNIKASDFNWQYHKFVAKSKINKPKGVRGQAYCIINWSNI